MSNEYSTQELMAVVLARDLKDGEVLRVGVAMPVVEAAVRLAHLLHGLNMELIFLRFRGPGSVGTATLSTHVGRYYIVLNSHTPRVFVERCDYISAYGWGMGGAEARRRLGLPGGGPKYCVTPLCVLDFDEESKRVRLHSLHPGVSEAEVQAQTGFALVIPEQVRTTDPPTPEELQVLRTHVDRDGFLRR